MQNINAFIHTYTQCIIIYCVYTYVCVYVYKHHFRYIEKRTYARTPARPPAFNYIDTLARTHIYFYVRTQTICICTKNGVKYMVNINKIEETSSALTKLLLCDKKKIVIREEQNKKKKQN